MLELERLSHLLGLSLFSSIRKTLFVGGYSIVVISDRMSNFLISSSVSF